MATTGLEIVTRRMRLIAASEPLLQAMLNNRRQLASLLGVSLAPGWPPLDNLGFMRTLLEALQRDTTQRGWGAWFFVVDHDAVLVGDGGFKGKPDAGGVAEIGYGIVDRYRNRGLATEAARALIEWAFANGASAVIAECDRDNLASVRVLEKAAMKQVGVSGRMLNWRREKG